jgi:hypothetical protein
MMAKGLLACRLLHLQFLLGKKRVMGRFPENFLRCPLLSKTADMTRGLPFVADFFWHNVQMHNIGWQNLHVAEHHLACTHLAYTQNA